MLLTDNFRIKLIDFGFSKKICQNEELEVFCGTPSYMSPEIIKRKPYLGKPADIWSLGVVLYNMITGDFPFIGDTEK